MRKNLICVVALVVATFGWLGLASATAESPQVSVATCDLQEPAGAPPTAVEAEGLLATPEPVEMACGCFRVYRSCLNACGGDQACRENCVGEYEDCLCGTCGICH